MTRAEAIRQLSDDGLANLLCELVGPDGCSSCRFGGREWCGAMKYLHEEVAAERSEVHHKEGVDFHDHTAKRG